MYSRSATTRKAGKCVLAALAAAVLSASSVEAAPLPRAAEQQSGAQSPLVKQLGTVKSVKGNVVVITPEDGKDVSVAFVENARIVRVEPGATDTKQAVPLKLEELQPGDQVRVRGRNSPDLKFIIGLELIAIKHLDIQAKHDQERADWQKRGIGGLVKSVDPAGSTVTITVGAMAAAKLVALHVTPKTVLRRYAPDSVKFDNAKPAPLAQIHPGDQ